MSVLFRAQGSGCETDERLEVPNVPSHIAETEHRSEGGFLYMSPDSSHHAMHDIRQSRVRHGCRVAKNNSNRSGCLDYFQLVQLAGI